MIAVEQLQTERCQSLLRAVEATSTLGVYLHSAAGGHSQWSRWSYTPEPARMLLRYRPSEGAAKLLWRGGVVQEWRDPLEALAWLGEQATEPAVPGPPFKGGWIGYLSYDLGRLFEVMPDHAEDDLDWPLFEFTYHAGTLAYHHEMRQAWRVRTHDPYGHVKLRPQRVWRAGGASWVCSTFTRSAYEAAVAQAIDYIRAGDIFQVNLSQRFTAPFRTPLSRLYRRLQHGSPAWFGAFLDYGDHALLCNSPELFLRITPEADGSRRILTRPIKGTRPRGPGMDEKLRHSIKDQAELNMIVDLERNDLGRVCRIGSVRVDEPRSIETHPTVYHGAATVSGVLRPEVKFVDILRATFPGGSITGAPKIRAMQIIEELEPVRRGPYCGAIGYLSVDGHIQFNIAIRTMIVKDGLVHMPVGGGIVADSTPEAEYEETLVKARAMFAALGVSAEDVARGTR